MASETAYPLSWPFGWVRSKHRTRAKFHRKESYSQKIGESYHTYSRSKELSVFESSRRLQDELDRLRAQRVVLSSNMELRLDGLPRSNQREPQDPGVAVYFELNKRRVVLACDKWDRVADNIVAVAKHIEALRGQERWGVGSLDQAFRGYAALEDFSTAIPWRRVLGFPQWLEVTLDDAETKYRERAKEIHPDALNGKEGHLQMAQLNAAIAEARKELRS